MRIYSKYIILSIIPISYMFLWELIYSRNCISIIYILSFSYLYYHSILKEKYNIKVYKSDYIFKKYTFFNNFFKSKILLKITSVFLSLILATIALSFLTTYNDKEILYIYLDILLIIPLYLVIENILNKYLNKKVLEIYTKKVLIYTNVLILTILYLFLDIYTKIPDEAFNDYYLIFNSYMQIKYSNCYYINYILQYIHLYDITNWYIFIQLSYLLDNANIKNYFLISILIKNLLTFFVISRVLTEIVAIYKRKIK